MAAAAYMARRAVGWMLPLLVSACSLCRLVHVRGLLCAAVRRRRPPDTSASRSPYSGLSLGDRTISAESPRTHMTYARCRCRSSALAFGSGAPACYLGVTPARDWAFDLWLAWHDWAGRAIREDQHAHNGLGAVSASAHCAMCAAACGCGAWRRAAVVTRSTTRTRGMLCESCE